MKKLVKLFKLLVLPILSLFFIFSTSVGILREVKKVEKGSFSYYKYQAEDQIYSFREYDTKLCLFEDGSEVECTVIEDQVSIANRPEFKAVIDRTSGVIRVKVEVAEEPIEGEATEETVDGEVTEGDIVEDSNFLVFIKDETPVVVLTEKTIVFSDYILAFTHLDRFEDFIGKHYFNSIFNLISGMSFIGIIWVVVKFYKNRKPNKNTKDGKKPSTSLKVVVPVPVRTKDSDRNPDSGIKF